MQTHEYGDSKVTHYDGDDLDGRDGFSDLRGQHLQSRCTIKMEGFCPAQGVLLRQSLHQSTAVRQPRGVRSMVRWCAAGSRLGTSDMIGRGAQVVLLFDVNCL